MKILYHHRTLGDGAEGIHVASMVQAFRDLGHEVRLNAMIGEKTNRKNGRTRLLQLFKNAIPQAVFEGLEYGYSYYGQRMLQKHIDDWQPDLIYERYTLFNFAGVRAAKQNNIPIILEVNAPLALERAKYEKLTWERAARKSEASICNQADRVVVVSTPLRQYLFNEGVSQEKIVVIPNGTNPERFKPDSEARTRIRKQLGIALNDIIIGFTGILRPWHGVDLLIKAFAKLQKHVNHSKLLIVGDGPSFSELKELAKTLNVFDKVYFTGRVKHDEIPNYLATCNIAVSPRATFYASPMKVPEYMATGLAVVAPKMQNLEDLILDGVDGILYEPENIDNLCLNLFNLIKDSKSLDNISRNARNRVLDEGTWKHNAVLSINTIIDKGNDSIPKSIVKTSKKAMEPH